VLKDFSEKKQQSVLSGEAQATGIEREGNKCGRRFLNLIRFKYSGENDDISGSSLLNALLWLSIPLASRLPDQLGS